MKKLPVVASFHLKVRNVDVEGHIYGKELKGKQTVETFIGSCILNSQHCL
jgi:hypothetical protein